LLAGVTYDTGALIAGDRNDRRMWALHVCFIAEEVMPSVPAPVVAEAWRGGPREASLARMLAGCDIEAMTSGMARRVGELPGLADHDDVAVVEAATRRDDDVIVTSNETHIRQVVEATGKRIRIETASDLTDDVGTPNSVITRLNSPACTCPEPTPRRHPHE